MGPLLKMLMVEKETEPYILHLDLNFPGQGILLGPFEKAPMLDFFSNGQPTALRSYFFSLKQVF